MNIKILKQLIFLIFIIVIGTFNNYSQEGEVLYNLNEQQREMIKAQKKLLIQNRAAFKATLTPMQLEILRNESLTKENRMRELMKSLTEKQRRILAENRKEEKIRRDSFRATLTEEQRQRLRSEMGPLRDAQEKRELRERIMDNRMKRRIRDN